MYTGSTRPLLRLMTDRSASMPAWADMPRPSSRATSKMARGFFMRTSVVVYRTSASVNGGPGGTGLSPTKKCGDRDWQPGRSLQVIGQLIVREALLEFNEAVGGLGRAAGALQFTDFVDPAFGRMVIPVPGVSRSLVAAE